MNTTASDMKSIGGVGRHQEVHRRGAEAEIDDADQDLHQGQRRRGQHHLPALLAELAALLAHAEPDEISPDRCESAEGDQPVERRGQLIHRGGRIWMDGHADRKHEDVTEPEGQARQEADLRDVDRVQPIVRIDPETDRAAGEDRGSDVVADRIGREAGERCDAIGHVLLADRSQCKKIVEGQRTEREEDADRRQADIAAGNLGQRGQDDPGIDALEGPHQRGDREGDDEDARGNSEPSPADPSLEAAFQRGQQSVHSSSRRGARATGPGIGRSGAITAKGRHRSLGMIQLI
ncbi:hypothetical protein AB7M16_001534 [Bradyrhizobium sp. USDA 372]